MKVLVVIGQLATGGAERVLYLLLRNLPEDVEATVVVFSGDVEDRHRDAFAAIGVPIVALPPWLSTPRRLIAVLRVTRRVRPDVVLSHSFYTNVIAEAMGRVVGARRIGAIRGELVQERASLGPLFRQLCTRWPRRQITNNHVAVQQIGEVTRWPFRPAQVAVIPQAVEHVPAEPPPYPTRVATPLVLGVGTLRPRKRWDLLIEAAARLAADGLDFRVVIAGKGSHRDALDAMIVERGLVDRVELVGEVDRPDRLLREAAMLVLPSDREGLPNVVLEAMAAARPVVVADSGDSRLAVEPVGAGLVVPPGDVTALAAAIAHLLCDTARAQEMGLAGWRAATERYTPERFVSDTVDHLRGNW